MVTAPPVTTNPSGTTSCAEFEILIDGTCQCSYSKCISCDANGCLKCIEEYEVYDGQCVEVSENANLLVRLAMLASGIAAIFSVISKQLSGGQTGSSYWLILNALQAVEMLSLVEL